MRPRTCDQVVKEIVLDELQGATKQGVRLTRDDLCALVHERTKGAKGWSPSTAARRVREAVDVLILEGVPVVSLDDGFFIAETKAQRDAGATRYRKQAVAMLHIAAALEGIPVQTYVRQLDLFRWAV